MTSNEMNRIAGQRWSEEDIKLAKRVLQEHETVKEAADALGVSASALRKTFNRKDLPPPSDFLSQNTDFELENNDSIESIRVFAENTWQVKRTLSNRTHLIIPDAHAKPGVSNERFDWLGKFIYDIKPDVVICIGDFADMESLSSYDKGKKSFEGRRYKKDVAATIDAQERIFKHVNKMVKKPRMVMCLGNHDGARIERATQSIPEFDGIIGIEDLKYKEFGWESYRFLDRVVIDGVCYSHYFPSGVMNRAIGGEHPAASIVKKQFMSCTQGHSHIRDFAERVRADGTKILGLVCGCYFEHDESYATVANSLWWRGLVVKRHVQNGEYEPEFVSMDALKDKYSGF